MNTTIKEQIIQSFLSLIENQKNVLVIGTDESVCKNLKQNSCEVTEINFDVNDLEKDQKIKNFSLDLIDLEKLEDKKFDVILIQNILLTLNPKQFLKKISLFLTKNGYIVSSMPNITNAKNRINFLNGNLNLCEFDINSGMNFLVFSNFLNILSEIDFSVSKLLRIKQNFFPQKIDAKDYGFPIELVKSVLSQPESETHTFIFKIILKNSVNSTLRKWLSTFTYSGVTGNLRDILVKNKDDIARLEGTIKDKDGYIEQVIRDKDEHLEQVIRDKDEFFKKTIKDKDNLIHDLEKRINKGESKKKRGFFR